MHASLARLLARMSGPATRTYAEAVDALNSLQSNAATIEAVRKSGGKSGHVQLAEQLEYMRRVGYQVRLQPLCIT